MKRIFLQLLSLTLAATALCAEPARLLEKADVLPLALEDAFEFRKTKTYLNDPVLLKPTVDEMIAFERQRINFGAVTQIDRRQRYGHYLTFYWRAARKADLTVRLEYRQENLGAFVQAQDKFYKAAKGSLKSEFTVIGDDYTKDGKITAWRAVLIENGRIVALNQSALWN
jgi:hypothetical protein